MNQAQQIAAENESTLDGRRNGAGQLNDKDDRPRLDAGDRDLQRIVNATLKIMIEANNPPSIFRHADLIARIKQSDDGSPVIQRLSEAALRGVLARQVSWYMRRKKKIVSEIPPKHVVQDILAMPEPPFPVIQRIIFAPVFAPDGTLTTKSGYIPAIKAYYDDRDHLDIRVPPKPAPEDVAFARERLGNLVADFPFVSDAEKSHCIGLIILPFVRELIDGPTPLHLIEKPSPGTGASLLTEINTTIFLGKPAAVMTEGKDEDEWRKRITAKLLHDNRVVLIDNVRRRLESSALSSALTSETWTDRIMGRTEIAQIPVRTIWIATGNNPVLSNEMARRTVRIRLDSKVDRPWLRNGFRIPNLREYALKERSALIWSVLVLIADWIAKNKPEGEKRLGSFEAWSKVIGGILQNADFDGFLGNIEELYEESDTEGKAWRWFVAAWWDRYGSKQVGVGDLYVMVTPSEGDPIPIDLGDKNDLSRKIRLGKLLVSKRDQQFDGKRIVRGGTKDRATMWHLQEMAGLNV